MITALAAAINGLNNWSLSGTTGLIKASTGSESQTGDILALSDKISSNASIQKKALFVFDMVSKVYELV